MNARPIYPKLVKRATPIDKLSLAEYKVRNYHKCLPLYQQLQENFVLLSALANRSFWGKSKSLRRVIKSFNETQDLQLDKIRGLQSEKMVLESATKLLIDYLVVRKDQHKISIQWSLTDSKKEDDFTNAVLQKVTSTLNFISNNILSLSATTSNTIQINATYKKSGCRYHRPQYQSRLCQ